ncbi:hypothetical protein ACH9D2_03590 [Kocuria sp. M4R2S49]|uniref:hypothetical protein n=1 Tax=Kocuria rhizosphaericola TaxID=3376284 RepID=UPI0037910173
MSPSRPARDGNDPQEPEQTRLDAELQALISDYQELHKDDARLRRIERIVHTGPGVSDEESGDRAGGIREEQIAPELKAQDVRRVAAGLLHTPADMRAYAARFVQRSTERDPAGRDLDRQAHALDAAGRHWLLMIGQNRDHGLVACRFVREKGIPHARVVSFTAERLRLPILVVELGLDEDGPTAEW